MIDVFDCHYCGKRLPYLDKTLNKLKNGVLDEVLICNVCKQKELKALLKKYNILSDIEN